MTTLVQGGKRLPDEIFYFRRPKPLQLRRLPLSPEEAVDFRNWLNDLLVPGGERPYGLTVNMVKNFRKALRNPDFAEALKKDDEVKRKKREELRIARAEAEERRNKRRGQKHDWEVEAAKRRKQNPDLHKEFLDKRRDRRVRRLIRLCRAVLAETAMYTTLR